VDQGDQPIYSIGAIARMLDVPASTIRAWEDRYGLVSPSRSEGAQRIYSRSQVEQLRFIKGQMDVGMSASDAHRLLAEAIEAGGVPRAGPALGDAPPLVLLGERDQYAAELAEFFLRTEGYDVCIAMDAVQARLLFEERAPDLVIIDLLISGGAGFRLCREFAEKGRAQILAVSVLQSADEAILAGASGFLQKPLESLVLVSAVRDLLGTSALARTQRRSNLAT
jgi:DNA-binding transcriptional MerR regulator